MTCRCSGSEKVRLRVNAWGDIICSTWLPESLAPSSALPIGAARVVSEMQPVPIDPAQPGSRLHNTVVALMALPNVDEAERYDEEILDLTATGILVM